VSLNSDLLALRHRRREPVVDVLNDAWLRGRTWEVRNDDGEDPQEEDSGAHPVQAKDTSKNYILSEI